MKPWERNWGNQSEAVSVKPWERNWSQTETEVDVTKIKASDFVGEQGFDNKPFEKLNNYIQKITEVKVNEDVDYSIKDAWEGFKNNLFKFEVRKNNEKPEGVQVLEDTAVEALDVGKQYAEATKRAVVNADIKDLGKGTKEVSKALGRATAEFTIGGVGKVVSMVGDLMYDETDITNMSKFEASKIKSGNFTAETYKKIGRYLQDLSDMAVQSDILKEDPEIFSGSFVENPSLTRLVSFGASAVPSLFTAGGLHKLGVPNKLNGMILAGLESSDVYGEAREAGKGKGEALGLFALSSAGTAYLETKGLDNLFDNKMKSLAGRMLTTMGSEGFTEYWQTVYQNAVKKYGYDATQDLFEGGFEALIGGIIGGGGAQVVNTSFDKFSKRADKYGVTQEEKMAILNAVSNETNAKSEQLNAMFQSNYDKSMKTLEEYINTNKDEAAVAQAVEKKRQLEKIYNDTYNELKNIMPEQEAKSNAALIRNSAFFYADEFGISPEEFVKKRGVKVVKSDYNQFSGKAATSTTEDMPIMRVTQREINWAKSHPEWKSNARIINMIGQAGADLNDNLDSINKALREYSIKEYKHAKEMEIAEFDRKAKELSEDLQERYAMMVENGVSPQEAYDAVTYTGDYIPFQTGESKALSVNISRDDYINPSQNYELPRLNKLDLEKLGKEDKPVILKKNIIQKNKNNHPEVSIDEYNDILTDTLINTTEILQVQPNNKPNYYTFVNVNKNDVSVVELSDNKDSYEVVNFFKINTKRLEEYRNKTAKDGGDIIITERKTQGAARLSALQSYDNNISPNRENVNRTFYQGGVNENVYKATNSNEEPIANPANFNVFIEGSRVTDNDEPVSPSNPPKKIYRGDTRYFEEYEEQENAFEYDWGRAFYLSDNYDDILTNYQSGGADLKNRIDREAEQLADEEDIDYDEAREKVRQKYEQEDIVREFYLSIKEPVIIGGDKETFFDYTEEYDEETDEYGEPEGKLLDLIYGIENYLADLGADHYTQAITGRLYEEAMGYGGLSASQVEDIVRDTEEATILVDYESGPGEMLSSVFGSIGFDGIIDHRAGTKFRNMDMDPDTTHYIVFNSEQAKSVDNKGEWGVRNRNFYLQNGDNDPKGAYVNRIIYLFQNADASTLPHELAHFWKDTLKDAAKMSKRAAKMLEDVEKWAEQEFNRKYSVQLKDGRYVVNNKQGLTVYDHNFRTEADAKEYAKEELFAQGNEAYLKEGVAPNNSLKQAFRNFLNWLKHIYNQARQLDIRLSPEIRQVYADILGGTEIDFFLNTDPDTFVENRIKLATETVNTLDEQIAEAQRMGVTVSEPDGRGLKHAWETAMIPLSTRLGRISNKLKNRLRRYEFDIANSLNHYYDEARPFLQKWKTFSEMDTIAFDIALKNDYVKKQLEIVDKYGAREEWEKVRKLLLDIFDSAVKAGLDVNFRPDYFPRKVKDVQGFLSYLRGRPEWTKFEEALRDADPERTFTAEEQADFINKYLRGFVKVDLMPYKYGSEKQRSIEIINNEMNKYYAPSMESLVSYIEGMNARIEASKFLGRDAENLDASVGGYLDYLINNKEIDPNKVDEVKEILKARFNQKGVGNKWIAGARNISYMYTMGGINSAITQIEDLSVSMYKAGIWNTLTTAFENKKIKRADLGLDKISAEFVENPSQTARGVEKLFKLTGLDKIDSFGKETLVNAMVKKFKQMSEESLRQYIEPIMEQETTQTIQDIKNGELSDNVLYLVFSELSDVQPISLSELPAFYNTSGNLRILYMLKSFMIKRIDIFRNECFDKLRSKDKEARIQGLQNLFRLALLMIFCGVSKDWLINMLYGRKMDIPETVVNNALGLVGFSKFHAYQLRDKGAGEVIKDFLMPPMFAPYDDLLGDIWRIGKGKRDLKDAESFKGIPLVGRFYYWHIGRGKEKMKKRNKSKLK